MKVKPLQDWAVIKLLEPNEKSSGGIIIPDAAREKPSEGIVEAIGPGKYKVERGKDKKKKFIPTTVKPGQRVIFLKYMTTEIELDGKEITLVREEDILGIFDENKSQVTVKRDYPIKAKEDQPPMVQKESKKDLMPVGSPPVRKTAKKKKPVKKKAVSKTVKPSKKVKSKTKTTTPKTKATKPVKKKTPKKKTALKKKTAKKTVTKSKKRTRK